MILRILDMIRQLFKKHAQVNNNYFWTFVKFLGNVSSNAISYPTNE